MALYLVCLFITFNIKYREFDGFYQSENLEFINILFLKPKCIVYAV